MSTTWKRFHGQRFRRRVSDTESFQEDNQDVNLGLIRSKQKASDPSCDKNITTSIVGKKQDLGILDPMIFLSKIRKNRKIKKNTL